MTTPGQVPVAEAAERSHLALRRAVVDVAMSLVRAGVLSHSGHADLSARVGPDAVLIATLNRTITSDPDDYRASTVLAQSAAYCVFPKAVALTALARAAGIPAPLGFADVYNHLASQKLLTRLGRTCSSSTASPSSG
jgi:hypothetical protein